MSCISPTLCTLVWPLVFEYKVNDRISENIKVERTGEETACQRGLMKKFLPAEDHFVMFDNVAKREKMIANERNRPRKIVARQSSPEQNIALTSLNGKNCKILG